jgi:hypothetical protein
MLTLILVGAAGVVAGVLIGINNPTLAAAVAKYAKTEKAKVDAAMAKVQGK